MCTQTYYIIPRTKLMMSLHIATISVRVKHFDHEDLYQLQKTLVYLYHRMSLYDMKLVVPASALTCAVVNCHPPQRRAGLEGCHNVIRHIRWLASNSSCEHRGDRYTMVCTVRSTSNTNQLLLRQLLTTQTPYVCGPLYIDNYRCIYCQHHHAHSTH